MDSTAHTDGTGQGRQESAEETFRRERDAREAGGSWQDDDGASWDEETGVYTLSTRDVALVLEELKHWSVSWDARSRNKLCFTSTTITPKMPSLGKRGRSVWQVC